MGWAGIRFELGQMLQSNYDADGFLRAQHDGLGSAPKVSSSEVLHPLGFYARGRTPDIGPDGAALDGGGCKLLLGFDGTEYKIILLGDQRAITRLPPLAEGSAAQAADTGKGGPISFDVHTGTDGTKQIYVEVGDSAHLVTIGKDGNGDAVLELVHADGMAITLLKHSVVIKNAAGNGYVEVNASGIVLNGNVKVTGALDVNGGEFLVKAAALLQWVTAVQGALNGLGVPIPPLNPALATTTLTKGK